MLWKPFQHCGKTYDLSHLHPRTVTYLQPAKGQNPPRTYTVDVHCSLHCFTRGLDVAYDAELCYCDDRETRLFDFDRHDHSHRLPALVQDIVNRKCFHADRDRGNYFTLDCFDKSGSVIHYHVYFNVSKPKAGNLRLYIESAYAKPKAQAQDKPIGFFVILYNTLNNKKIKVQT